VVSADRRVKRCRWTSLFSITPEWVPGQPFPGWRHRGRVNNCGTVRRYLWIGTRSACPAQREASSSSQPRTKTSFIKIYAPLSGVSAARHGDESGGHGDLVGR